MYLVLTGLAAAIAATGIVSARRPRPIPVRVRAQRRIVRRN